MTDTKNNSYFVLFKKHNQQATLTFVALSCLLAGCGNAELNSQSGSVDSNDGTEKFDSDQLQNRNDGSLGTATLESLDHQMGSTAAGEVLSFSLAAADVFCPAPYRYNAASMLCESPTEALGPFTLKMVSNCVQLGGGSACSRVTWAVAFAKRLRGVGVCPDGATRHASTGLCIEGQNAFGPFSKTHVEQCKFLGGGEEACETMRWSRDLAESSLPFQEQPEKFTFPFSSAALASYLEPPRSFASCRDGCARRHAGADLYGEVGRPIYAVADGTVLDFYAFYLGTYALVVDHGDFIVRYGEITSRLGPGVSIGKRILRGQRIAEVGNLDGLDINMLHFERYSGRARGSLTGSLAPFYRRSDLVNPTDDLIKWKYPK